MQYLNAVSIAAILLGTTLAAPVADKIERDNLPTPVPSGVDFHIPVPVQALTPTPIVNPTPVPTTVTSTSTSTVTSHTTIFKTVQPTGEPSPKTVQSSPQPSAVNPISTMPGNSDSCPVNGALVCNGPNSFGLCNWGKAAWQPVAKGTMCANGKIVAATN